MRRAGAGDLQRVDASQPRRGSLPVRSEGDSLQQIFEENRGRAQRQRLYENVFQRSLRHLGDGGGR